MAYISVVVPLYNNAGSFGELIDRLTTVLSSISNDFEIVCVDDRGPEPIWPQICAHSERDPRVKGIRLSRNFGQHPAITAGLSHVDADWVVVMDGDLQDRPEDIAVLHAHAVENDAHIVVAAREQSGLDVFRNIGSRGFNFLVKQLSGLTLSHRYGNYRIFSRKVHEAFTAYGEQMRLFTAIMAEIGFDPVYLELPRDKRKVGKSSYNLKRLLQLAYSIIINYSTQPLMYFARIGLLMAAISACLALFIIVRVLIAGTGVPGWTSLIVAVSFFGGLQLALTSFVGLYVGQTFQEAKRRPLFIVMDETTPTIIETERL